MSKQNLTTFTSRAGRWVFFEESWDCSNEIQSKKSSEPIQRHPDFFFDNTLVAIQIEQTLFNVHKYKLVKSEVFSDMFNIPTSEGEEPVEGSSPEHPIKLEGVAASDFAALLRVLYASHFTDEHPTLDALLVIPAFRVANMFNFSKIRAHLLPLAERNLDDVDKIVFAREFDIEDWVIPAHVRLCQREKPLNDEEARKLGVGSVLIISRMREKYRIRSLTSALVVNSRYCSICVGINYLSINGSCDHCGVLAALHRFNGPGRAAQVAVATMNDAEIEADVKRWVEDGCSMTD